MSPFGDEEHAQYLVVRFAPRTSVIPNFPSCPITTCAHVIVVFFLLQVSILMKFSGNSLRRSVTALSILLV